MDRDDNWDLYAVVRGCRTSPATRDPFSSFAPPPETKPPETSSGGAKVSAFTGFLDPYETTLEELCMPFFLQSSQNKLPSVAPSSAVSISNFLSNKRQMQRNLPRSKRRKRQQKKIVCRVPADGLSSDMWSWRKYGQKPIKGSPYPRGYYRCSSSKGCLARKQVERCRTDPKIFIVTYTADHDHPMPTHRNSLAGVSRQKNSGVAEELGAGNPAGSPTTPLAAEMEDEVLIRRRSENSPVAEDDEGDDDDDEGILLVEDMEVMGEDDLFFVGEDNNGGFVDGPVVLSSTSSSSSSSGFYEHFFGLRGTAASAAAGS